MKKLLAMMLMISAMLAFTACSNDDEPENSIYKQQLIGLWDAIAVQPDGVGKWVDTTNRPDLALSISFYEDGSYYGMGALGDGDGTYTLSGNTIKTYIDGQLYGTYVIKSLAGDQAELTLTMDGETIGIRAKKSKISFAPNDHSIVIAIKVEGTTYLGCWTNETIAGSHYVSQSLTFDEYSGLTWHIDDYTINNNGHYVIKVNGEDVRATKNSQTIKNLTYSYDGKTLVTRDDLIIYTDQGKVYPSYEERVYSAIVNEDKLTIQDGTKTTIYVKNYPFIP